MKISGTYGAQNVAANSSQEAGPVKEARQRHGEDLRQKQDLVQISSDARFMSQVQEGVANASDVRSEKVEDIKSTIEDGSYKVDARRVADWMLLEMLG